MFDAMEKNIDTDDDDAVRRHRVLVGGGVKNANELLNWRAF